MFQSPLNWSFTSFFEISVPVQIPLLLSKEHPVKIRKITNNGKEDFIFL